MDRLDYDLVAILDRVYELQRMQKSMAALELAKQTWLALTPVQRQRTLARRLHELHRRLRQPRLY